MSLKHSALIIDNIRNAQGAIKKSPYGRSDQQIDFGTIKSAVDDSMKQKKEEAVLFNIHRPVLENIMEVMINYLPGLILIISGGAAWSRYYPDHITSDIDVNVLVPFGGSLSVLDARYYICNVFTSLRDQNQLIPTDYSIQIIDKHAIHSELYPYSSELERLYSELGPLSQYVRELLKKDPLEPIYTDNNPTIGAIEFIRVAAVNKALSDPNNPIKIAFNPMDGSERPLPLIEFSFTALHPGWLFKENVPYPPKRELVFFNRHNNLYYLNLDMLQQKLYKNVGQNTYLDRFYGNEKNITNNKLQSWKMQVQTDLALANLPVTDDSEELDNKTLVFYIRDTIKNLEMENVRDVATKLLNVQGPRYPDILSMALESYCRGGIDLQIKDEKSCDVAYQLWKIIFVPLVTKIGYNYTKMIQDFVFGEGF